MPLIIISVASGIARAVARPPEGADELVGAAVDHERGRADARAVRCVRLPEAMIAAS